MAINGILTGTTSNQMITPEIRWSAVQNYAENYSVVTASLHYSRVNTGYTTYGTWEGSLSINGETLTGSRYIEIGYQSGTEAIIFTVRVPHNADGAKSILIEATGCIPGTTLTKTDVFGTVTLNTIPRASTVAATDANIEAVSMIAIGRKSAAYTHSVAYQFGSLSGYITPDGETSQGEVRFTAESVGFRVPAAFYGEIPDASADFCALTVRTYDGDTLVGQPQQTQFVATAAKEQCSPLVSGTVVDINEKTKVLTGDERVLVRFCSDARCTLAATARNGATIVRREIGGKKMEEDVRTISNIDRDAVVFSAKDSRGYESSETVELTLIPYVKPTCIASVERTDPTSGNAVLSVRGSFFAESFGAAGNTVKVCYRVGAYGAYSEDIPVILGETYTTTIALTGLDYNASHEIYVKVEDQLTTVSTVLQVKRGIPVFDWGENDFVFHVPVVFERGFTNKEE